MISEHIYCELTGEESVHLTDWPDEHALPHDAKLVAAMDLVRDVCSEVLSIRKAQRLRVRLPLAKLTIAAPHAEVLRPFLDLIADEVNVKTVELRNDPDSLGRYQLSCNPGVIGPRIGQGVQQVLAAARRGDWKQNDDGTVCAGGETLYENEFELRFLPSDENSSRSLPGNTGVVVLDINPTPELENEGAARDLVRLIQSLRRDANLIVTDRIVVTVVAGTKNTDAFRTQLDYVASQTLAQHIDVVAAFDETTAEFYETSGDVREENVTVRLQRVTQ